MTSHFHSRHSRHRAFTLLELLCVITVIAILLALLFPLIARFRVMDAQTKCASNLRSVGQAIQLYANDNKGTLPGPISLGIPNSGRLGWEYKLGTQIGPYMGYTFTKQQDTVVQELICPSVGLDNNSYVACHLLPNVSPTTSPFGYSGTLSSPGDNTITPLKLATLTSLISPPTQWAIQDSYGSNLPAPAFGQVYGSTRHNKTTVLFFDGHVESK